MSMSQFMPPDHNDCIIATEIVTSSQCDAQSEPSETSTEQLLHLTTIHDCPLFNTIRMYPFRRKYLSIVFLLLFLSVFCIISTSIIDLLANSSQSSYSNSKESNLISDQENDSNFEKIQLEEIFQNLLTANYFNGSWVSNDQIAFYDAEYNLCLYNVPLRKQTVHIKFPNVLTHNIKGLKLSKDLRFLLWPTESIELFRYSKLEKIKIYNIHNNTVLNLFSDSKFDDAYFQFAKWGPRASQLVFAYQNNLYYKDSIQAESIRLTVSGKPGVIFNGHTDWLYEEEILNSNKAVWFSPDGDYLAYLEINDTLVDVMSWNKYGEYFNISNNQYPVLETIRYPKPGTNNPQVRVFVVNLHVNADKTKITHIPPPPKIADQDHYLTNLEWFDNERVLVAWTIRNHTRSILALCDMLNNWSCEELYEVNSYSGWVDGFEGGLIGAPHANMVVMKVPRFINKSKGYYYHVAGIDLRTKRVEYLTDGTYDVIKLISYSPLTNEIFYASTLSNHPEVQHIMKISLNRNPEPICLTCYLGNSCRFNEAIFNLPSTNYVLECRGYEIPRVQLRDARTNDLLDTLENNNKLFQFLKNKHIPRYEKIFVKLVDNYDAIVELILPYDFDENKVYPLVIELYGAPGTQMVKDKYEMNHWSSYLTTERQYVYARVDVRGTCNQGIRYMHQLYKNIGHVEVDDLIDVVWFLKNNLTYINSNQIAVWGWSYGGYFSLMSLIREYDTKLFSCAIAVAPVSNWMYYDSSYSERYLGIPDSRNLYSYQDSNLLDNAVLLKNKKFMIVFGTSDDNVHIQHSLLLIRKLNELNIDYDVQIYPDDNHYLQKSSPHLYRKMSNYIDKCFK